MADIAAGDVTYTIVHHRKGEDGRQRVVAKLVFGDGALTYPSGGIPLTKAKLACPTIIESLSVYAKGTSGYEFSYVYTTEKLLATQAPVQTHAHDLKIIGSITVDENVGIETTAGPILGATTAQTVAKADSATKGGVLSETLAAAALSQPSAIAIAAQTLYVEVVGY